MPIDFPEISWTPVSLSDLALWLDADDASTITLNGSTVSQWNDKSGNGRHATQTTPANQPTRLSNEQNGRVMLDWDGSDDRMDVSGGAVKLHTALSGDNTYSIAMVIKADVVSNQPVILHEPTSPWQFLLEINNPTGIYWGDTNSNYRIYTTGTFASTSRATFFTLVKTGSGSGDAYAEGTLISSFTGSLSNTPTMTQNMILGWYSNASFRFNGKFGEVIISSSNWDTATRQKVEGYLAHKWGLQSNLPADHPYKSVSPGTIVGESYSYKSKQWTWNGNEWYLTNPGIFGGLSGPAGVTATDDVGGACAAFGMPGSWVRPPHGLFNVSIFGDTTYFVPMWINSRTTIDRIAMRTVSLTTSGVMNMAIFNDHSTTPGRPGTVRLNAGSVSYTANSTTYSITIDHTLERGWYWFAHFISSGSSTWRGNTYVESYWVPRMMGDPSNSAMYPSMVVTLSATFGNNPAADLAGYSHATMYARIKA